MTVGSCSKCPSCQRGLQEQGIVVIYTLTKKVLSKGIVFFVCVPLYPERETVHLQQLLVFFFYILLRFNVWPLFFVVSKSHVHTFFQLQKPYSNAWADVCVSRSNKNWKSCWQCTKYGHFLFWLVCIASSKIALQGL